MITESKITEIFCIADDFFKEFEQEIVIKTLFLPLQRLQNIVENAVCQMQKSSLILICFHFNSFRNFKYYYLECVCKHWKHLFPKTLSYNRFVEIMSRCFVAMTLFLKLACFGECTGISFVDSTCIPVIHNKRQFSMKVFKDIAAKGKSTMGWYVGFKLHLLCNGVER